MSTDILTKDIKDRRWPVLGVGVFLFVISVFALGITQGMSTTLADLSAHFPEAMNTFIGTGAPGGYVVNELFSLIAPLALVAYAVVTGAPAVAGEEAKGTMSLLSAQPVARTRILAEKLAGMLGALAAVMVLFWAGITLAARIFRVGLDLLGITAACLHLFFLAVMFGAVAFAVGAATGRPEAASAVGGLLAAVAYLANGMLPLANLDGWARLSPWYYYLGADPLREGIDPWHLLVMAGVAAAAVAVAFRTFPRRDLRG